MTNDRKARAERAEQMRKERDKADRKQRNIITVAIVAVVVVLLGVAGFGINSLSKQNAKSTEVIEPRNLMRASRSRLPKVLRSTPTRLWSTSSLISSALRVASSKRPWAPRLSKQRLPAKSNFGSSRSRSSTIRAPTNTRVAR